MITIRTAAPEELPQLRDLWRKCFGDPGAYGEIIFQHVQSRISVSSLHEQPEAGTEARLQ